MTSGAATTTAGTTTEQLRLQLHSLPFLFESRLLVCHLPATGVTRHMRHTSQGERWLRLAESNAAAVGCASCGAAVASLQLFIRHRILRRRHCAVCAVAVCCSRGVSACACATVNCGGCSSKRALAPASSSVPLYSSVRLSLRSAFLCALFARSIVLLELLLKATFSGMMMCSMTCVRV